MTFLLGTSVLSIIQMLIGLIKKDEEWERYIVVLIVTSFLGVVALVISSVLFIASKYY